jgi:hypothetical protein
MSERKQQGKIRQAGAWVVRFARNLALVHNVAQALPWLGGIVLAAVTATFGFAKPSDVALSFGAGVGVLSALVLSINFLVWFLERQRIGWKNHAKQYEKQLKQRDEDLAESAHHLEIEREKTERLQIAAAAMHGLSLDPLVIQSQDHANDRTRDWISSRLHPVFSKLEPGVGLGLVAWRDGTYRLVCDHGVPEIIRAMLPKRTNRHLSMCMNRLGLNDPAVFPLSEGMMNPEGQEWLVAFPEDGRLDHSSESVLAVGARIIANARSRGDGTASAVMPVPS